MRFLSAILLCGLTVPALAETQAAGTQAAGTQAAGNVPAAAAAAAASKFGLRVVRTMPESHQALLYDKLRNTHVLVEVGKAIDGFTVTEVEDDEVTMAGDNTSVILTAPAPARAPSAPAAGPAKVTKEEVAPTPAPVPSAEGKKDAAPEDPYREVVRVVEAPPVPAEVKAPMPKPIETPALKIDPAVAVVEAPASAPAPAVAETDTNVALSKGDVAAALGDFGKLASSVRGAQVANGIRIDKLAPGSMYAKAGLREGDIVMAIDGKPFRTVDDAADLYARAGGLKTATVVVLRSDKPLTLHVAIQ